MAKVNSGFQRATSLSVINGNALTTYSLLKSFIRTDQIKYGLLYNWYATQEQSGGVWLISDAMRAAGWAVPSDANFTTLVTYLGGADVAGGKLKEMGFTYWYRPNTGATNEVGFNARGSGLRTNNTGVFANLLSIKRIWSKTNSGSFPENGWGFELSSSEATLSISEFFSKKYALSIRLVRPATAAEQLLPDGTACDPYIGNDGKIYRTVKIGTQVWLADNLAETKWSDGAWIAGFDGGTYTPISNAAWAALTTAALCAYNDDMGNVIGDITYPALTSTQLAELSFAEFNKRVTAFIEWINEQEGFDVSLFETNSERALNETACPVIIPTDYVIQVNIAWTDNNQGETDGLGGSIKLLDDSDIELDSVAIPLGTKIFQDGFIIEPSKLSKISMQSLEAYIYEAAVVFNVRWRIDGGAWTETSETSVIDSDAVVEIEVQTKPFA